MGDVKNKSKLLEGGYNSPSGRIFLTSLNNWMQGKNVSTKMNGTKEEVAVVEAAMHACKNLYEELYRPDASVSSISEKLNLKHAAAADFERLFGLPWPL